MLSSHFKLIFGTIGKGKLEREVSDTSTERMKKKRVALYSIHDLKHHFRTFRTAFVLNMTEPYNEDGSEGGSCIR